MPLSPVKIKLDALNSKLIFYQCQTEVLVVLLALTQCYLFPFVMQLMRACGSIERERERENEFRSFQWTQPGHCLPVVCICNASRWLKMLTAPLSTCDTLGTIMQIQKHCTEEEVVSDYVMLHMQHKQPNQSIDKGTAQQIIGPQNCKKKHDRTHCKFLHGSFAQTDGYCDQSEALPHLFKVYQLCINASSSFVYI